jgi:hypothetical protein
MTLILSIHVNIETAKVNNSISPKGFSTYGEVHRQGEYVSILNLISNPDKYDKTLVSVIGVVDIERDGPDAGSTIYLSKDDYKYNITKNGLWIYPNYKTLKADYNELRKFNGKYVLIVGTFNKNSQGAWGLFSGCIDDVTYINYQENLMFIKE